MAQPDAVGNPTFVPREPELQIGQRGLINVEHNQLVGRRRRPVVLVTIGEIELFRLPLVLLQIVEVLPILRYTTRVGHCKQGAPVLTTLSQGISTGQ